VSRVRAADGSGELPVPSYDLFSSTELLGRVFDGFRVDGLSIQDQEQEARKGGILGGG